MNQGKLEVVKQDMVRVNINILGISELKWTGMGKFNSDDPNTHYYVQESHRRNELALVINKTIQNTALWCNLKKNKTISIHFQGKPFNITVIQVCASITNAEEDELEWIHETPQDLLELTPKKDVLFINRGLECKRRKSKDTWSNRQVWSCSKKMKQCKG